MQRIIMALLAIVLSASALADFKDIGNSATLDSKGFSVQVHDPEYGDMPAYLVEMQDGKLIPQTLVVPAKTKFRIIVRNIGHKPAEFESNQLRQEKMLYMNAQSVVVVMPLDAGTYDYFDDFTPGPKGQIVAKEAQ